MPKDSLNTAKKNQIIWVPFGIMFGGLILLNAFSGMELFASSYLLVGRALLNLTPAITFVFLCSVSSKGPPNFIAVTFKIRVFLAFLVSFLMVIGLMYNQPGYGEIFKVLIFFLHLANLTFFIPAIFSFYYRDSGPEKKNIVSLCYILVSAIFVFLATYLYLSGKSIYWRVGYPFIPGVFGYMCVVSFVVSLLVLNNKYLAVFFALFVFLSGSRSSLALLGLSFFLYMIKVASLKSAMVYAFLIFLFSAVIYVFFGEYAKPYLSERDDFTSGRSEIWMDAGDLIAEKPLLGYSKDITFETENSEKKVVAHNSFIDLSLSYGIVVALLCFLVWATFFYDLLSRNIPTMLRFCGVVLFVLVTMKSLVANIFWTNMGDGITYFVVVFIIGLVVKSGASRYGKE